MNAKYTTTYLLSWILMGPLAVKLSGSLTSTLLHLCFWWGMKWTMIGCCELQVVDKLTPSAWRGTSWTSINSRGTGEVGCELGPPCPSLCYERNVPGQVLSENHKIPIWVCGNSIHLQDCFMLYSYSTLTLPKAIKRMHNMYSFLQIL